MSKIDPNKLLISSDFYTVQGEGISSGIPAYFVRLGICNLTCGMSRAFTNQLLKDQKLEVILKSQKFALLLPAIQTMK